jgi:DNA invertase Pin-like site-specific DNA recombinase
MDAVFYTRKSKSRHQDQKNSEEIQVKVIEEYADRNGMRLVKHFHDSSTGTNNRRPSWRSMLRFLEKHKDVVVVFYRVDRIGRNLSVFEGLESLMDSNRVYVVEHGSEPIDSMTLGIMLTMAKQESKNISIRTKAAYKLLKEKYGDELRWGSPNTDKLARTGQTANQHAVIEHWTPIFEFIYGSEHLFPDYLLFKTTGRPRKDLVIQMLNAKNITTRRGNPITYQSLQRAEKTFTAVTGSTPWERFRV